MHAAKELVCSWSTSSSACCHQKGAKSGSLLTWGQSTANGDNQIHFRNVFLIWVEFWPWIESCPGMLQALLLVPFFKGKPFWLLLFFNLKKKKSVMCSHSLANTWTALNRASSYVLLPYLDYRLPRGLQIFQPFSLSPKRNFKCIWKITWNNIFNAV